MFIYAEHENNIARLQKFKTKIISWIQFVHSSQKKKKEIIS